MCGASKIFREPVNTLSHMAGAFGSIAALTLMVVFAAIRSDAWHVVSCAIFGTTLILMYTSSFLYHGLKLSARGIEILRKIDHIMIFLVIAGSYTPICLVTLRGAWGWSILGTVWGIALAGGVIKIWIPGVPRWISTLIYLTMGWICIIAFYPLIKNMNVPGLLWLALGGAFYSAGAVIYAFKKPDFFPRIFGFHEIWHLFVLFGSFCHFWMVLRHL